MTNQCNYILGPCVDGTQAGKRCSGYARPGESRCSRHGGTPMQWGSYGNAEAETRVLLDETCDFR